MPAKPSLHDVPEMRRIKTIHFVGIGGAGMENRLLEGTNIPLHHVSVKGLRGAGLKKLLLAPFMILQAFMQSLSKS